MIKAMKPLMDDELREMVKGLDALQDFQTYQWYRDYLNRELHLDSEISTDNDSGDIARKIIAFNREDFGIPKEERKPIILYTMSYGGDLDIANSIIDCIEASTTPVYTVNIGSSCSAGALIYLSGHKRFATEKSALLLHEGSAAFNGTAEQVQDAAQDYKIILQQMYTHIEKYTKIPNNEIKKMMKKDWTIRGEALVEKGCADTIIKNLDEIVGLSK